LFAARQVAHLILIQADFLPGRYGASRRLEIEGPHTEAAIVSMKMQPVKVWQGRVVTRDKLAVDDKGSHAFQARQGVDHPTDTA
jgi:hypothetical protein